MELFKSYEDFQEGNSRASSKCRAFSCAGSCAVAQAACPDSQPCSEGMTRVNLLANVKDETHEAEKYLPKNVQ